jgi:methionyl-tRNA formyltransferase
LINSLINDESENGVCIILGEDEFDAGAIITQSKSLIHYPFKISEAIDCMNRNYLECFNYDLSALLEGLPLVGTPQGESKASHSVWHEEKDDKIDWTKSASEIRRMIDAVGYPYLGAFTMFDGKKIQIFAGEETADVKIENRQFGKALFIDAGKPLIICGQGMLKITEAHIEHDG